MARIAVGGFQHETNTFAPQQATWDDFVRADAWPACCAAPEMIDAVEGFNVPISGAVKRLRRARPRDRAARLGCRAARVLRHRGRLRAHVGDVRRGPAQAGAVRCDLPRPAWRDGRGEHAGRRGRVAAPHPRHRRRRAADRGEPRLSREFDAGDGEAVDRAGRLSHLSAHRHGGDRQARGRTARPAAQGEAAGLSRLSPARLPHPAGLAVHLHRAGQEHLRSGGRARGRREEPQPGHRLGHPHAGLPAGRHRPVRPGAGRLRPRQGSGRSGGRQARRGGEGAGEGVRRRAARSRCRGAARDRAVEERRRSRSCWPTCRTIPAPAARPTRSACWRR